MQHYDVVIVGAGIWGLCAAHTFLKIDQTLSLMIVDCKKSIGGVWATEQLYPGLRTNNLQGYYEFSDYPMLDADVGVLPRGPLKGEAIHAYLHKFAEHFDLMARIRLETKVVRATETNDSCGQKSGWELELDNIHRDDDATTFDHISCTKLVIATGQVSAPFIPSFKGLSSFTKPAIHTVDLAKESRTLLADDIKDVTVVGGSKSAHDAVLMLVEAGKHVHWIVHAPSQGGRGAVPMAKPYSQMGPWNVWMEPLLMTRALTWFGVAPWADGDGFSWIRWFLHSTRIGARLVKAQFFGMTDSGIQQSGILDSEKTKVLLPADTLQWYATQANSLNYDTDFYEPIRNDRVTVILGSIERLDSKSIFLKDQVIHDTDALVLATGYDFSASVPLEPTSKRVGWGCPVDPADDSATYVNLDDQSDKALKSRFVSLNGAPVKPERLPGLTPWRLWRGLAPPSQVAYPEQRNLVFLNAAACIQNFIKSELTSLWAYAYLYDGLAVRTPSEEEAMKEVSMWTRFGKWRCPYGLQGKQMDMLLDAMPYYDLLLRDLGLRSWRKGWGLLGEIFAQYHLKDYKGVVEEWMKARGKSVDGGKKQL